MASATALTSGLRAGRARDAKRPPRALVAARSERRLKDTTIDKYLQELGGLLVPGCYDAFSARLMASRGYKVPRLLLPT